MGTVERETHTILDIKQRLRKSSTVLRNFTFDNNSRKLDNLLTSYFL